MGITFEREYGYWSQLAVIFREKLEECLEGLEHLMSPLLYQLSYTPSGPAKLTTYDGRIKRGVGTVPGIVSANHFARCILELGRHVPLL